MIHDRKVGTIARRGPGCRADPQRREFREEAVMVDLTLGHDMIHTGTGRAAAPGTRRSAGTRRWAALHIDLWAVLNSQIVIWFLSGIVVTILTNLWSGWQQTTQLRANDLSRIEMLDLEVMDRLYRLSGEITAAKNTDDLQRVEIYGIPPAHGIYGEFQDRSLKGLVTELLYLEKKEGFGENIVGATHDAFRLVLDIEATRPGLAHPWNADRETYRKLHALWAQRADDLVGRWPRPETLRMENSPDRREAAADDPA
jgi:hypothetical protein